MDNARENEIRLQLYQSYKQGKIYRCGISLKMAVTLLRALTFLHLIALCHLETSRSLSEITGNQHGYVFSSFYQDFPAVIATKRRAAFYLPSKPAN